MKEELVAGFECYICGEVFPDQTERATPCAYERFGLAACKACCEKCHKQEPFPCSAYNRRKHRERREAGKA
ncbi:MAG: hypothetical protein IJZ39_11665 [Oscillospiraceae bacterium]|nr:hypothetical protein [Oscillospiraceae bacterium]